MLVPIRKNKYLLFIICAVLFTVCCASGRFIYADEYKYDEEDRVIEIIHDDGSVTLNEYDSNGNIVSSLYFEDEKAAREYIDRTVDDPASEKQHDITNNPDESGNIGKDDHTNISGGILNDPANENDVKNHDLKVYDDDLSELSDIDNKENGNTANIKTGDDTPIVVVTVIMVISIIAFIGIIIIKKIRKKQSSGD